ncbi:MAG TPA: NAD(P)-dependent alcohol dehydrogenase [Steroidobacteraceae bacterium]|nr:NAD(P)-dependent alcohol dehydrogenase [Steroidobacteraceae bacterium]
MSTTSAAEQTRRYELERADKGYKLALRSVELPALKADEVLVRIRAVSLNHRDLYVLQGVYGGEARGNVPVSDGAGEVLAIGPGVKRWKVGDRVATTFFERWNDGPATPVGVSRARGGGAPGVLAEKIVTHEDGLVRIPDHLSFEEAATLPCAAVTAWNGLFKHGRLQRDQWVLLEGTGGVSIFGLQFAAAAGARPIITSSSDAKLQKAKSLGAVATVNYRTHPEWQEQVRAATKGAGVSHVLEIGGKDTLPRALAALGLGGHVALIGGLTGFEGNIEVGALTGRLGAMTSIYVGSRADFEAMNEFISRYKLKPVIDRVFEFEQSAAAFEYLESGSHFGKVAIRL